MQPGTLEVSETTTVSGPPDEVWARVGAFDAVAEWHPAVASCALEERGAATVRTLALEGGGTLVEERLPADGHAYAYTILEGPLPVARYRSELRAEPEGGATRLTWSGAFDAEGASEDEAVDVIRGIYRSGLDAIAGR